MRAKRQVDIEVNEHKRKKRKNNPAIGLVNTKTEPLNGGKKQTYSYDPHLSPQLQWAGKQERTSFAVPTVSLHTHEKIDPRAIIERVRKTNSVNYVQMSLFKDEQIIPEKYDIDFYKHDKNWSNRLIAGDSLLVMNSLLVKEGMAGKVQCIYIDPPYGIKYGSNFQPFTHKRDVKDGKDLEDLTSEPEMLKAFRDTWELGIHSYLAYLRDRLLLARELLTDSGSCFVQISDENVHFVRCIMDEIFGKENFVSEIVFRKKQMPLGTKHMETSSDFIIWYARKKDNLRYRQLYLFKNIEGNSIWNWVELTDGTRRQLTKEEINNHKILPSSKIFRNKFLTESKNATGHFQYDVSYHGETFNPKNKGKRWVTHKDGMKRLMHNNRVVKRGNSLEYVLYYDDYSVTTLMNVWQDTGSPSDMRYVVQTNTSVIQRCLLMTTDPGDLVLDPTCGSGTTSYVAEQWGRRWITCDTSRVAITLAKQRLLTAVYDYYKLENPYEGVSSGFQYQKVPHVTLGAIANDEPAKEEILYDKPLKDNKKKRVSAPFTVEAVPAHTVQSITHETKTTSRLYEWLDEVERSGIRGKKGIATDMKFVRLETLRGFKYLHAEGETTNPRRVVISFGSEHAPLDKRQVELALQEAQQLSPPPDVLIFAAFHFDAEASRLITESNKGKI